MPLPMPPLEFKKACRNIGPDIEELVSSMDDMVKLFLNGINREEAAVIRPFLDEVLGTDPTPDQLKELWWSTPATTVFHDGRDVSSFLTLVREVLAEAPYASGGAFAKVEPKSD